MLDTKSLSAELASSSASEDMYVGPVHSPARDVALGDAVNTMAGYPGDADVEVCAACPSAQVLHLLLPSTHVGQLEDERGERRHPAQVQHPVVQVHS